MISAHSLLIVLFTLKNFWVFTPQNTFSYLEAKGARQRTYIYTLNLASFGVPGNLIKSKNRLFTIIGPVRKGTVNSIKNIGSIDYGDNDFIFKTLGVNYIHEKGLYGQDITVGVFDTGFDSTHPAISPIYREQRVIAQYDFNSGDHLVYDTGNIFLSDSFVYINSMDINDTFIVVSYASCDNLALNDNAYRLILLHSGFKEKISENERAVQPSIAVYDDTVYVAYEVFNGGYMQIELAKRIFDGIWIKTLLTSKQKEHLFPKLYFNDDTLEVFFVEEQTGIMRVSLVGDNVLKEDTVVFSKYRFTYFNAYTDDYFVSATSDSIFLYEKHRDGYIKIFGDEGFSPGFNPYMRAFYYSKSDGTHVYFVSTGEKKYLSGYLLTSPPSFDGDSIIFATFNDYSVFKLKGVLKEKVYQNTLSDLVKASKGELIIRQRGDADVMPDTKDSYNMHGTQMLSLIGGFWEGRMTGIAPLATFVLCKTERGFSPSGTGFENVIEEDFWVEALEYAHFYGAKVISSSLGYSDWYDKRELDGETPVSSRMASRALSMGMLVINAMGNYFHGVIPQNGDTSLVAPADARGIIAVGGCDSTGTQPVDCSYGPSGDGRIKPEVVAPFYAYWSDSAGMVFKIGGTSVSTAMASGLIAALWSKNPDVTAGVMRDITLSSASLLQGYSMPNNITGYGRIDVKKMCNYMSGKSLSGDVVVLNTYPNPFRKSLSRFLNIPIRFAHRGNGTLLVFSVNGKLVKQIDFSQRGPGIINIKIEPGHFPCGLYNVFIHTSFGDAKGNFIVLP